jgi:hypothetical protein
MNHEGNTPIMVARREARRLNFHYPGRKGSIAALGPWRALPSRASKRAIGHGGCRSRLPLSRRAPSPD